MDSQPRRQPCPPTTDCAKSWAGFGEDSIKDYGGENLGTLLRELYPRVLGPAELWEYFGVPSRPLIGRFYRFWSDLPDTSPPDHLPAHLDYLAQSGDAAHSSPDLPRPNGLPLRFLARTIKTYGERVEMSQLTAWLRVGLDEWGMLRPEGFDTENASSQIRQWLEAHPETQKAVIRFALRTDQFRELESVEYHLNELLYRSSLPEDIGAWHLDQAVTAEDADLTTKHLMEFTRSLARRPVGVDATLADARSRLRGRPDASHILDSLLRSRLPEWHLRNRKRWQHVRAGTVQPDASLLRAVRSEEEELENNCASPGLLHSLAQKYYGHRQVRDSPGGREHLVQALGSDERLTEVALGAIRRTIERDDLPSAEELVRLRRGNLMSAFVWPVLIGLADRPADKVVALGDARLRAALACRLLQLGLAQEAAWYKRCVRERPDLVAEVLILVGRVLFAAGETSFPDLRQLARDKDHAEVARQATLPLLRAFPARASDSQLVLLDALLWRRAFAPRDGRSEPGVIPGARRKQGATEEYDANCPGALARKRPHPGSREIPAGTRRRTAGLREADTKSRTFLPTVRIRAARAVDAGDLGVSDPDSRWPRRPANRRSHRLDD